MYMERERGGGSVCVFVPVSPDISLIPNGTLKTSTGEPTGTWSL